MERIRTLIADDDPSARVRLRALLDREPGLVVIAEGGSGREALTLIREHRPQLAFLDVQMADLDGFDVLRALDPRHVPVTVFLTAYDTIAIEAFEMHAIAYLLKPYSDQRFEVVLRRACACIAAHDERGATLRMSKLLASSAR